MSAPELDAEQLAEVERFGLDKPPVKVYAFCNSGAGTEFQIWYAMAETGEIITSHCSSHRGWGIHDVGPAFKKQAYEGALGEGFDVEYIVVDERKAPPAEVVERNRLLGLAEGEATE